MFAPRINGTASSSFTTFLATIGTTSEVVTELERMAAVVSIPQPKDFSGLWKKNLWNLSGDPKPRRFVSTSRKKRIDPKRSANESTMSTKPLPIVVTSQDVNVPKPPKSEKPS